MLQVQNLTKKFYTLTALDNITLAIPTGEILGILGPNGAGKSTLFKILSGSLTSDAGEIVSTEGIWPTIGYKPERLFFPERMRVTAYLRMMSALSNIDRHDIEKAVASVLTQVGLTGAAHKRIKECSKGMRQRLGLAQALLGRPTLLILDEPSDGLDPSGQLEIQRLLHELRDSGTTILMSSHQLAEVRDVCTEIAILNFGRIIYRNRMTEALAERPQVAIHVDKDLTPLVPLLQTLHDKIEISGNVLSLHQDAMQIRRHLLSILLAAGYDILRIERRRATLTEIYAEGTK